AGQSTEKVLRQMDFNVRDVRLGRHITLTVESETADEALAAGKDMARRLLANPVIESYDVTVQSV
ncbi:MAG: phosphoribosylformylglycinamidine synthase subunit PurS, partial [Firmicutes bacterium]|nr:phosphoribosylformylglycinamidine synthase subunit PurS [Bacillota bacterium]